MKRPLNRFHVVFFSFEQPAELKKRARTLSGISPNVVRALVPTVRACFVKAVFAF